MSRDIRRKNKKDDTVVEEAAEPQALSYLSHIQQSVELSEEGGAIAVDIMKDIYERASEQMISNYFDRTAIPYTVQNIAKDILDLIQFVFIGRDDGDENSDDAASWLPDEEPDSVPADSWARGAIPTRRRPPPTPAEPKTDPLAESRVSTASRRSGRSRSRRREEEAAAAAATQPASASPRAADHSNRSNGGIRSSGNRGRGRGGRGRHGRSADDTLTTDAADADAVIASVVDPQHAALEQQRQLEREEEMKMEQMVRDLKATGKDFTLDSLSGKVIPIRHVDPRRLPTKSLDVRTRVVEDEDADNEEEEAPPPPRRSYIPHHLDKKKKRREPKIPPGTWQQPEDQTGPMVEEMRPSGGVTLREGDIVRKNDMKPIANRPSQAEFRKTLDAMGIKHDYLQEQEKLAAQILRQQLMNDKRAQETLQRLTKPTDASGERQRLPREQPVVESPVAGPA